MMFDVAITTFRRPDLAVAAVKSCLNQGRLLHEVVIVNDASGDDTPDRLRALNDPRIKCHISSENGGTGMARHLALKNCTADWVVLLDSDWELRPGALDQFARLIEHGPDNLTLAGSRLQWDTGIASPAVIPQDVLDYHGQVRWRSRPDGLWQDNLACVSQRALQQVEWPAFRVSWHANTLFFLDVAKLGTAIYSPDCLGYQKSDAPFGDSRGTREYLLARRTLDSESAILVCDLLLARHGDSLREYGPLLLSSILRTCSMYALLAGDNKRATRWLWDSARLDRWTIRHAAIAFGLLGGRNAFRHLYTLLG